MSKTAKMVSEIKPGDMLVIGTVSFLVTKNVDLEHGVGDHILLLSILQKVGHSDTRLRLPNWIPLEVETPEKN